MFSHKSVARLRRAERPDCSFGPSGFTLVELLVVIGIITILLSLLLPAVQNVRESARRKMCSNNLRQIGIALHNYHELYGHFPPGYVSGGVEEEDPTGSETDSGYAWMAMLLPMMEGKNFYDEIDFDSQVNDTVNIDSFDHTIGAFLCPSEVNEEKEFVVSNGTEDIWVGASNYVGVYGYGNLRTSPGMGTGVFYRNSKVSVEDIDDGSSHTFMVGERTQTLHKSTWAAAVPGYTVNAGMPMMPMHMEGSSSLVLGHVGMDAMPPMMPMPMHHTPNHTTHVANFSSHHPGGTFFLIGDGSVRYMGHDMTYEVFRNLGEINDGNLNHHW